MFSFFNRKKSQNVINWEEKKTLFSYAIHEKVIMIGNDYIWLSGDYQREKGMIEYNVKMDKINTKISIQYQTI